MAALWLLLSGLFLLLGGAEGDLGTPPLTTPPNPLPPLPCPMVGPGGVLSPHPALLRLWGGGEGSEPPPSAETPQGQDSVVTFDVTDPWAVLSPAWGGAPQQRPPRCELSPTVPNALPPPWAPSLAPPDRTPPTLGGLWWVLSLKTSGYGVSSLLRWAPPPQAPPLGGANPAPGGANLTPGTANPAPGTVTAVTATLSVLTLTPQLTSPPGPPLKLHCSFVAPPGPFALEWRRQHLGRGHQLLAYDSGSSAPPRAAPGVRLLLGEGAGGRWEVSLRLDAVDANQQGTYVCAISLPHGSAQQLVELRVLAPPQVSLWPQALEVLPGAVPELLCVASGYFPLEATIRWEVGTEAGTEAGTKAGTKLGTAKGRRKLPLAQAVAETWSSGPRLAADGSYSRSGGARLVPVRAWQHGEVYSCLVSHPALPRPRRASLRLQVAGATGPSLQDLVGFCLVAFGLCHLCHLLRPA